MDEVLQKKISEVQNEAAPALIKTALEMEAIKLSIDEPFTWASGYKMPIYNDNRKFLQCAETRKQIALAFSKLLNVLNYSPSFIAGTATAGIPHATTLADLLGLPLSYVRQSNKTHGLCNVIEGLGKDGSYGDKEGLVIEDLISTGMSSINACQAVRDAKGKVPYCFAIFSYGMEKARDAFASLTPACIPITIITYDVMIEEACKIGYINEKEKISLQEWKASPFTWWEDRNKK
ncbi:MAG: orotate phosphoribosyltransferase [Treponema sp.]